MRNHISDCLTAVSGCPFQDVSAPQFDLQLPMPAHPNSGREGAEYRADFWEFVDRSISFKIQVQAQYKAFGALIEEILSALGWNASGIRNQKRKRRLVGSFLACLFLAFLQDGCVALALDRANFFNGKDSKGRYWFLSYEEMKSVTGLLVNDWKVVEQYLGKEQHKKVTRFWISKEWEETFQEIGAKNNLQTIINWEPIPRDQLIICKDTKGKIIGINGRAKYYKLLIQYNEIIQRTDLTIGPTSYSTYNQQCIHPLVSQYLLDNPEKVTSERLFNSLVQLVELPSCNELQRIFSRGSRKKGGRLYHAVYQTLPEELRSHIHIDGQPTVEWDYKSLHLAILYNHYKGLEVPSRPFKYDNELEPELRKIAKEITYSAFNADKKDKAVKALWQKIWLNKNKHLRKALSRSAYFRTTGEFGKDLYRACAYLYDDFRDYHGAIGEFFNSDIGVELQYHESLLGIAIVRHFTKQGIPVLVIHDSFIVQEEYGEELKEVMEEVYLNRFGFHIQVT